MRCASPGVARCESRAVPPWIQPLASFAHTKLKRDFYELYAHMVRSGRLRTCKSWDSSNPTTPAVLAADVTSTWSTATSGNWNVNANWTNVPALGGFPNNGNGGVATYDATISPVGSPYTVTLSTNVTVEDLLLSSANATLSQTSGTFTATGAITLSAGTFQLNGGTISNTTVNVTGGTLVIAANTGNLLSGVTVNGDLTLNTTSAGRRSPEARPLRRRIWRPMRPSLGFAPGQTLAGTILFEGAVAGTRHVEMNGTAGSFTIGATGVIRTNAGLTGDGDIGGGLQLWRGDGAHQQRTDLLAGQRPDHHRQPRRAWPTARRASWRPRVAAS